MSPHTPHTSAHTLPRVRAPHTSAHTPPTSACALPNTGNGGVRGKATKHFMMRTLGQAHSQHHPLPSPLWNLPWGGWRPLPTRADLHIGVVCKHLIPASVVCPEVKHRNSLYTPHILMHEKRAWNDMCKISSSALCACVSVCVHQCICVHTCVYACISVCACVCIYLYVYYMQTCVCMCLCVYIFTVYVLMRVSMCVCICMHMHLCVCVCISEYCVCTCVYMSLCVSTCVYIDVLIYVCMYLCAHICFSVCTCMSV